ncbi:MAG: ParB N-terminal domain-containing protein [Candidatus Njordarchaeia archaeon]
MKLGQRFGQDFFQIDLDLEEINRLYIHEEIIPTNLEKIKDVLKRQGFQIDPIIVDRESGVILDGMHRYEALKQLGFDYILTAKVNYFSPNIIIRNWYRTFKLNIPHDKVLSCVRKIADSKGFEISESDSEKSKPDKKAIFSIWIRGTGKSYIAISDKKLNVWEKYMLLKSFETELSNFINIKPNYRSEELAVKEFDSSKIDLVLATPPIKKEDVVNFALNKKIFPPKTTRHILPVRPLFVNVPLPLLKHGDLGKTLKEKREILRKLLLQKTLIKVKGEIIIDRFYEERALYIFI